MPDGAQVLYPMLGITHGRNLRIRRRAHGRELCRMEGPGSLDLPRSKCERMNCVPTYHFRYCLVKMPDVLFDGT